MIDLLDEVWVLCLPGWYESVGVLDEIQYAYKTSKPVYFIGVDQGGYEVSWTIPKMTWESIFPLSTIE